MDAPRPLADMGADATAFVLPANHGLYTPASLPVEPYFEQTAPNECASDGLDV